MDAKLLGKLEKRQSDGVWRELSLKSGTIDFFSNDYLGIARDFQYESKRKAGSTGSRLLSGNSQEAITCEKQLAAYFGVDAALVFNSGYTANLGVFSSIPQRGDTILYDAFVHASIRDGIRLSFAKAIAFHHNDLLDLEAKLQKAEGTVYVAVESLYSMDGDKAPLVEMVKIIKKFKAYLIVDEAHACGVYGKEGRGLVDELGLNQDVFIRIATFGKAWGFHGAAVHSSENVKNYLINFARSFIYTTALPPQDYDAIHQICLRTDWENRKGELHENIRFFRSKCTFVSPSDEDSPIQILRFPKDRLKLVIHALEQKGIMTKAIFPPTVPEGNECIRLCLHAFNTHEEINVLCETLMQF